MHTSMLYKNAPSTNARSKREKYPLVVCLDDSEYECIAALVWIKQNITELNTKGIFIGVSPYTVFQLRDPQVVKELETYNIQALPALINNDGTVIGADSIIAYLDAIIRPPRRIPGDAVDYIHDYQQREMRSKDNAEEQQVDANKRRNASSADHRAKNLVSSIVEHSRALAGGRSNTDGTSRRSYMDRHSNDIPEFGKKSRSNAANKGGSRPDPTARSDTTARPGPNMTQRPDNIMASRPDNKEVPAPRPHIDDQEALDNQITSSVTQKKTTSSDRVGDILRKARAKMPQNNNS
jgi:hypothetical protein